MADLRILEIFCACVAVVFALLGFRMLLNANLDGPLPYLLDHFAQSFFLILFGIGAAMLCAYPNDGACAQNFGFLICWSGRGIFFLVMGCYLYPNVCPYDFDHCFNRGDLLSKLGAIAAVTSIILGIIILILRCTTISESGSRDCIGSSKSLQPLDIAAAVASVGVCVLGFMMLFSIDTNGSSRNVCQSLSLTFIILTFGITSLISSIRNSQFVQTYFGYLFTDISRGVYFLLIGFYTFAIYYNRSRHRSESLTFTICGICSCVSMVVGVIFLVKGLGGR